MGSKGEDDEASRGGGQDNNRDVLTRQSRTADGNFVRGVSGFQPIKGAQIRGEAINKASLASRQQALNRDRMTFSAGASAAAPSFVSVGLLHVRRSSQVIPEQLHDER
jgi:hypothetical protein